MHTSAEPVAGAPSPARSTAVIASAGAGLRAAAPALLGYALVRAIGLAVLWWWSSARDHSLLTDLGTRYDAAWLMGIAEKGYNSGVPVQSNMAFFPLYPELVHALSLVLPVAVPVIGIGVAWASGLAAAWGLFALGRRLYDARTGTVLAILWGVLPHAIVESMAYTESLLTALAVWCLFALLSRRWLTSGILALLAGLERPTAVAVIAVVCLAGILELIRGRGRGWRVYAAIVLAPPGWVAYLLWVAYRTGRLDGWFRIQSAGWHSSWDFGAYTLRVAGRVLTAPAPLDFEAVTVILVVLIALLVLQVIQRQPWQLILYSALMLALTIGAGGYYNSKARFLIPAFALLLPPAVALARASLAARITILALLTLLSAYFGGYLLLVWDYSP